MVLGGIGFLPINDVVKNKTKKFNKLKLQSKIVISATTILTIISLIFIRMLEPTISWHESFFASITLRTAGFYITDFSDFQYPYPFSIQGQYEFLL